MGEVVYSEVIKNRLVYVEPRNSKMSQYKKLIRKQGEQVCQDQTQLDTILNRIQFFDFGFIHISSRTVTGKSTMSLNGFVFCTYSQQTNEVVVDLICSRKHMKLEKMMLNFLKEKAYELGATRLTLMSLAEDILRDSLVISTNLEI
jgi:hypothetical protein